VFARADAQCDALEAAADVGHYVVDVARSTDAALQSFVARQHDVVIVDTRHGSDVDAEPFARSHLSPCRAVEGLNVNALRGNPSQSYVTCHMLHATRHRWCPA